MKWIVFGLGSGLGLGGLVAISQGYDIVQVERGWTLVISGATALSAGIVTIALGFVVASVESLIAVSGQEYNAISPESPISDRFAEAPVQAPAAEAAGEAFMAFAQYEEPASTRPLTASDQSLSLSCADEEQKTNRPDFSFSFEALGLGALSKEADASITSAAVGVATASSTADSSKARPRSIFSLLPRVPTKSILSPGPWPTEPRPSTVEPQAPTRFAEAQTSRVSHSEEHDWLEQALAGVDLEESAGPKSTLEEEVQRAAEAAIVPPEEPATPAVVGRYESGGASYVLFADGSIEAETDSGFYRFASMVELKKFIEGGT